MNDTIGLKSNLCRLFDESVTNEEKFYLTLSKLKQFGGKLYKYYSFEDEWSLKNLGGDVIHFSILQSFNDPFDCFLGFSISKALEMLLPTFIDKKLNFSSKDPKIKEIIKYLLSGQSTVDESKEAKLLSLVINLPCVRDALSKGEAYDPKNLQIKIMNELLTGESAKDFFNIIQSNGSNIDLTSIPNSAIYLTIIKPLLKQPNLINYLFPKEVSEQKKFEAQKLIDILAKENIVDKIKGLAELSGQDSKKIDKELHDIDANLKLVLRDIKEGINKSFAISCFSETPDNVLMWSHYGNKHTGFCVEYDFNKCKDLDALIRLFPVQYSENRPSIPASLFDLDDLKNIKVAVSNKCIPDLMMLLLSKSDVWQYEKEWRIIGDQAYLIDGHIQFLPIVSGIYAGANISDGNLSKLICIAKIKKVKLHKYSLDNDKYKLNLEQI